METVPGKTAPARLASIDAYRGFVMLLMMAEVLHLGKVAANFPGHPVWEFLKFHTDHVAWAGCSLHDLIQPSFSFLVGVALPFSMASRIARGQTRAGMTAHACWRALLLVLLGVFLRSLGWPRTNWTFDDTLTQIGLGYPLLFLLGFAPRRVQWSVFATILIGYWLAWALYPVAPADFDFAKVGVPADWPHLASGFLAHWNKNANLGAAFDQWFMNLFPRGKPFVAHSGGYLTLNFIPTLGTMLLGLIAGGWLRGEITARERLTRFAIASAGCFALGLALSALGVCPIVKTVWTPAWTLFSGGWCFLLLAAFYAVIDLRGWRAWAFPLVVIGMNSIAAYCIAWLFSGLVTGAVRTHIGADTFKLAGPAFAPLLQGIAVLLVYWLILLWMYRRGIFLKI
jgi:predicted acyltransferase